MASGRQALSYHTLTRTTSRRRSRRVSTWIVLSRVGRTARRRRAVAVRSARVQAQHSTNATLLTNLRAPEKSSSFEIT